MISHQPGLQLLTMSFGVGTTFRPQRYASYFVQMLLVRRLS